MPKKKMLNDFVQEILHAMFQNQFTVSDIFWITTTIQMQAIKGAEAQKSAIIKPGHLRVRKEES